VRGGARRRGAASNTRRGARGVLWSRRQPGGRGGWLDAERRGGGRAGWQAGSNPQQNARGAASHLQDPVLPQVAVPGGRRPHAKRLVGHRHVRALAVGLAVDRHSGDPCARANGGRGAQLVSRAGPGAGGRRLLGPGVEWRAERSAG
jgi:hypothetical protein